MKILYECDLAGSIYHGMAYRIFQFSKEFVKLGHEVMIVAASYSHLRRRNPVVNNLLADEIIDGINYRWIKTPYYKGNGLKRAYHILIYNYRLYRNAKKIAKDFQPNVVIASGVTPLDFIGCKRIAKISKAKILLEVGDLWPLSPIELGGYSRFHPFIMIMQLAENYAYTNADTVISLLPYAKDHMVKHGLKEQKYHHIPNGIVLEDWEIEDTLPDEHLNTIERLKSEGKFLLCYAGSHGIANSLNYIIKAVEKVQNHNIVLILVGDGQEKSHLIAYVKKYALKNVYFLDPISKSAIPTLLKYMDVLFIGLQKEPLFRFGISPNKIFDYMMASKPIIQAIDAGNNIVKEAKCGIYVQPENSDAIADAIIRLQAMTVEDRNILGENGYRYVHQLHNYSVLTQKFIEAINK